MNFKKNEAKVLINEKGIKQIQLWESNPVEHIKTYNLLKNHSDKIPTGIYPSFLFTKEDIVSMANFVKIDGNYDVSKEGRQLSEKGLIFFNIK
ncbi:hypothetical protein [Faecalibacter bovis]|uniref:Uncharacterized protein n=1 Tax=Faecalibacter bovis TaxID=2898187 RepID=A0ABX7XB92_9FLAO|nr:hypothetical protein [Faecalibacter bovis]QTV05178.1 hypothetical protein J9309_10370 [Faecalibacter bovis]